MSDDPNFSDFWTQERNVAAVDPADLCSVWKLFREVETRTGSEQVSIDFRSYERVCNPGADVTAVWFRASMLGMMMKMVPEILSPWSHDGEFDDAVFQVAAAFPMKQMRVGVVQQGPPFDVEEFVKQIGARA